MRILIEEYPYEATPTVIAAAGDLCPRQGEERLMLHYVGYFYNPALCDVVFILPKVVLEGERGCERVLGRYRPEEIVHLDAADNPLTADERRFVSQLAVWLYRAIAVYRNRTRCERSNIIYQRQITTPARGRMRKAVTYLDVVLELVRFARENSDLIFSVIRNRHGGHHKIDWRKTIARTQPVMQGECPIYLNPVVKHREANMNEELLIIFLSILHYLCKTYGFPTAQHKEVEIITGQRFERYLAGHGARRLRAIRHRYYADRAVRLWELCFAFFDRTKSLRVTTGTRDYLLVKNFYVVFEAIIDALISDHPSPDGLRKDQDDGKVMDHLYRAESLMGQGDTYYIGDSKYYKMASALGKEAVSKQYTYARNLIQANIDVFLNERAPQGCVRLRDDDVTEGYNVIPNFFISGLIRSDDLSYANDYIDRTEHARSRYASRQYDNRLFDRDTLLLYHYDVNFLFVLALYARNQTVPQAQWRAKVREHFREDIRKWLMEDYAFYLLRPINGGEAGRSFIDRHFKLLHGKIYRPFGPEREDLYLLALEREGPDGALDSCGALGENKMQRLAKVKEDNRRVLSTIDEAFLRASYHLGDNPDKIVLLAHS